MSQEPDGPPPPPAGTEPTIASAAPVARPHDLPRPSPVDPHLRYQPGNLLGAGGMGEVRECLDRPLGRTVAMKTLHASARSNAEERFLHEARLQGQLEHPAIVPVYELGLDHEEKPFFTMKKVSGITLADAIDGIRQRMPGMVARFSETRLLNGFRGVCQAVAFAHERGVLHQDLKPANVMFGGYGEVYVLDWGLAETLGPDRLVPAAPSGLVAGTPGYMSPEQSLGEPLGPASDVFALGAILYELLTLTPLVRGHSAAELMQATVDGLDARPSSARPDLPWIGEFDEVCARATAADPSQRPTARELHDAIEAIQEGKRDAEKRKEQARHHVARARAAIQADDRRAAIREVGTALALDPENRDALLALVNLVGEPPKELPPEVRREREQAEYHRIRVASRSSAWAYASLLLYLPVMLWMGVRDWRAVAFYVAATVAAVLVSAGVSRMARPSNRAVLACQACAALVVGSSGVVLGPLIVLPGFAAMVTLAYFVLRDRSRDLSTLAWGLAPFVVPVLLIWAGVLENPYEFGGDRFGVRPTAVALTESGTWLVLVMAGLGTIVVSALSVGPIRNALRDAEERLALQAWHFRQLVPGDVSPAERLDDEAA